MDKHIDHNNILHKTFNRKMLKMSYFCTKNIFEIINNHNYSIIIMGDNYNIIIRVITIIIILVDKTNVIVKREINAL